MAARDLHDEVFGDALSRAANAEHFRDLIEVNRAGVIEQLAFIALTHEGEVEAGMIGRFDLPYVMRSIDSVAKVFDAVGPGSQSGGLLSEPPPPSQLTEEQRADNQARVDEVLHDLATANERGEIAGTAAIVFGRHPAFYRFNGSLPPSLFARILRALRQQIERGQHVGQYDWTH
jgi:hypothetical protein